MDDTTAGIDPERRKRLVAAQLRAMVADTFGAEVPAAGFSGGAAGAVDGRTFFLTTEPQRRGIGAALAHARRHGADEVHVITAHHAGDLAREAAQFVVPPVVWRIEGTRLHLAEPEPPRAAPPVPGDLEDVVAVLRGAGCDVTVEHGVVSGEVMGLEVARVIVEDGQARVEVGVGAHDREAFQMLHGHLPTEAALAEVVGSIAGHRSAGAEPHPLNRIGAERWLRALVMASPGSIGAERLAPLPPRHPRGSLLHQVPAGAAGVDAQGHSVVAVCSVGIDLELVPRAADLRAGADPEARLLLVVPKRDAHPVTELLARAVSPAAEVAPIAGDWRHLGAA